MLIYDKIIHLRVSFNKTHITTIQETILSPVLFRIFYDLAKSLHLLTAPYILNIILTFSYISLHLTSHIDFL